MLSNLVQSGFEVVLEIKWSLPSYSTGRVDVFRGIESVFGLTESPAGEQLSRKIKLIPVKSSTFRAESVAKVHFITSLKPFCTQPKLRPIQPKFPSSENRILNQLALRREFIQTPEIPSLFQTSRKTKTSSNFLPRPHRLFLHQQADRFLHQCVYRWRSKNQSNQQKI